MANERLQIIIDATFKGKGDIESAGRALKQMDANARKASEGTRYMKDQVSASMKNIGMSMGMAGAAFAGTAMAAKQAWQVIGEGAQLDLAANRFDNLAAKIGASSGAMLGDFRAATGGMMSDAEMIGSASQIIELGLAGTSEDVVRLGAVVGELGLDMSQVILTFANDSKMRLDALGLSITDVEARTREYEKAGIAASKAFDMAVLDALEARVTTLGSAMGTTAGDMKTMAAEWENVTNTIKQNAAEAATPVLSMVVAQGKLFDALEMGIITTDEYNEAINRHGGTIKSSAAAYEDLREKIERGITATDGWQHSTVTNTFATHELNAAMVAYSKTLSTRGSLEDHYAKQHLVHAQMAIDAEARKQKALDGYTASLSSGADMTAQYASAAMASTTQTNALADSLFRTAAAAAAEQAALLGTFNALSQNEEALADYATIMGGAREISVQTAGATAEQRDEMERLQGIYDKAAGTIRDYELGLKGVGMSEEKIAENIAEQQTLMANAQAALAPLTAIQSEYATVTDGGAAATELLNEKLFSQIQASSDSAAAIALAGVALGVYTEAEANAMLKSALLEEMIRKQAEAWDGTAAGLATIQGNIEGYISVLNGIPDVINTTVSTDYQSTGTPPPWAGGPSSGDTGESGGQWGGEQMAAGGLVTGGVPGRDSVPALLMPGEYVLPVGDPRNPANGGGSSANVTINVYGGMAASPQAIAGAVSRAITPRG